MQESDLAMSRCCCGSAESISRQEKKLRDTKDLAKVMKARKDATRPAGVVGAPNNNMATQRFYTDDGVWLYPPLLWISCGGACGGGAVCSAGKI